MHTFMYAYIYIQVVEITATLGTCAKLPVYTYIHLCMHTYICIQVVEMTATLGTCAKLPASNQLVEFFSAALLSSDDAVAGTQFTCFTSTKVQILQPAGRLFLCRLALL